MKKKTGRKYDLLLPDIFLERMNGMETAVQVMRLQPGICVAFITSSREYGAEAFELNAVDSVLQVYGFLIQTVLAALLWHVPFPEERLCHSGRRLYWMLVGTLAAFAVGFAMLSGILWVFCSRMSILRVPFCSW